MHATKALLEADRLMTVCNSCRYCEGLCAVFPAMEMRRAFPDGDLNYLANLCHGCGACYIDCQFSPPHQFDVNVPKALAKVRAESYAAYAWPSAFSVLFARNGLAIAIIAVISVSVFILGFVGAHNPQALFQPRSGAGSFYALMPHNAMASLFGGVFLYAIVALCMGVRAMWRSSNAMLPVPLSFQSLWQAMKDASSLRYLDGGGDGCYVNEDHAPDRRRLYHHLTFYGFMLCFAATSVATLYHYLLHREAPYPWYDLPVVLGTLGGVGLIVGPVGLLVAKWSRDAAVQDEERFGMDVAFLAMLFLTSLTGLVLLVVRDTAAMPMTLAFHLGVVFALFLTMPYGKFVHGIYRYTALVRYVAESKVLVSQE